MEMAKPLYNIGPVRTACKIGRLIISNITVVQAALRAQCMAFLLEKKSRLCLNEVFYKKLLLH